MPLNTFSAPTAHQSNPEYCCLVPWLPCVGNTASRACLHPLETEKLAIVCARLCCHVVSKFGAHMHMCQEGFSVR